MRAGSPCLVESWGACSGVRAGSPRLVKIWGGVFVVVGAGNPRLVKSWGGGCFVVVGACWQPALGQELGCVKGCGAARAWLRSGGVFLW